MLVDWFDRDGYKVKCPIKKSHNNHGGQNASLFIRKIPSKQVDLKIIAVYLRKTDTFWKETILKQKHFKTPIEQESLLDDIDWYKNEKCNDIFSFFLKTWFWYSANSAIRCCCTLDSLGLLACSRNTFLSNYEYLPWFRSLYHQQVITVFKRLALQSF